MLRGRRIVLGVTGGVAAYKAAYLARRAVEMGAELKVVMTESATRFVGPQTFAAITGEQPTIGLFAGASVSPHTELARWADAVVIAPATASTLSRIAHGLSEDALSATVLATAAPIVVAPAMHTEMWEHSATVRNIAQLREDGVFVVDPTEGPLAGGDVGVGRLAEPDAIIEALLRRTGPRDLEGWAVLVSAGGTKEPIDPVRYVGNRSSGKMGNAIALAAARRGAQVFLVTSAPPPDSGAVEVMRVETAAEMADAVWATASKVDVAVLAAAVADFRPVAAGGEKLRRSDGPPELELEPTPDILAGVVAMDDRPFVVGFAAETGDLGRARVKTMEKGVDLLVANDVARAGSGFGTDTNEVTVITPDGETEAWELLTKDEVAHKLWDRIAALRGPEGGAD
ncbi:MAG: bifunctional phosphopantothenoylcysteine decarboxylase/phosphopantothenate--cysteine ligase CoaBC [Acidimicrobiia bacterium]